MFPIIFLASLVLVSILATSMLSKNFACVLLRLSYGSQNTGRRGVSAFCTLAKLYKTLLPPF